MAEGRILYFSRLISSDFDSDDRESPSMSFARWLFSMNINVSFEKDIFTFIAVNDTRMNRNTKRLIAPVLKTVFQDDELDCPILWKDLLKLKAFFRISTGFKISMKYYFEWRSSFAIYLVDANYIYSKTTLHFHWCFENKTQK